MDTMMGRIRRIYVQLHRLWEQQEARPHGKSSVVVVVILLVALAAMGEWYGVVAVVASLAIFAFISYLLGEVLGFVIDFGQRSWIGYVAIAALAWRVVAPVQRCDRFSDVSVGRWLPWQAACHYGQNFNASFTVDVGATALQVLIIAAVIAWALSPALKQAGKRG